MADRKNICAAFAMHVAHAVRRRYEPRADYAIGDALRRRLGRDLAPRFDALIDVVITADRMCAVRRSRDRLLARGDTVKAQPLGRQLAQLDEIISDLLDVISAPVGPLQASEPEAAGERNSVLRADARAREVAPFLAEIAEALNAMGVPYRPAFNGASLRGEGNWTAERIGALISRLKRIGVNWQQTPSERPAVRTRTRAVHAPLIGPPVAEPQPEQPR